jgi:hypothetical protein
LGGGEFGADDEESAEDEMESFSVPCCWLAPYTSVDRAPPTDDEDKSDTFESPIALDTDFIRCFGGKGGGGGVDGGGGGGGIGGVVGVSGVSAESEVEDAEEAV